MSAVNLPALHSRFGRWPSAPLYRCYAVRYSPVLVGLVPNMHRVGARFQQANTVKGLILAHQAEKLAEEEDKLCSSDEREEEIQEGDGKNLIFLNFHLKTLTGF